MCIVRIANNINRNVYMHLNTRIFPTTGYARVLLFMFIRRELGGMVQDVYFSLHTVNIKKFFGAIALCKFWHLKHVIKISQKPLQLVASNFAI